MTCDHTHERGLFTWSDDDGHRAYGAAFPDGTCVMIWDRWTWPREKRLLTEHFSLYGCVGDVLDANGGRIEWGTWNIPEDSEVSA